MNKFSAPETSDFTLIAALFFLLLLYVAHNAYVAEEVPEPQGEGKAVVAGENTGFTQR